jgi:hypothetical protein
LLIMPVAAALVVASPKCPPRLAAILYETSTALALAFAFLSPSPSLVACFPCRLAGTVLHEESPRRTPVENLRETSKAPDRKKTKRPRVNFIRNMIMAIRRRRRRRRRRNLAHGE